MNTIVRTMDGQHVVVIETVAETVKVLKTRSGFISINLIKESINAQLPDRREHLTYRMVQRAIVAILSNSSKSRVKRA